MKPYYSSQVSCVFHHCTIRKLLQIFHGHEARVIYDKWTLEELSGVNSVSFHYDSEDSGHLIVELERNAPPVYAVTK